MKEREDRSWTSGSIQHWVIGVGFDKGVNGDGVGDDTDECNPELRELLVSVGQAMVGVGGVGMGDGAVIVMVVSGIVNIISVISETALSFCFIPSDCVLAPAASSATGIAGRGSSAFEHTIVILIFLPLSCSPSSCLSSFPLPFFRPSLFPRFFEWDVM